MDLLNIAVAANSAYFRYMYVMLTSVFESNRMNNIDVYIISSDLDKEQILLAKEMAEKYGQSFHYLKIDRDSFPAELPTDDRISMEAYYRLALPEMLPLELDRVLYLDVDIIVNKSLKELYFMDLKGKTFAACSDYPFILEGFREKSEFFSHIKDEEDFHYFNSGVLLFDLVKAREKWIFQDIIEQAEELKDLLERHGQDLLNYLFWDDVELADVKIYNFIPMAMYSLEGDKLDMDWIKENVVIYHYAGAKPWDYTVLRYPLEIIWWEYAKKTPYYTELMEEVLMPQINTGCVGQFFGALVQENDELRELVDKSIKLLKLRNDAQK